MAKPLALLVIVLAIASCNSEGRMSPSETLYTFHPATWFEDGWSYYAVSPDGRQALFGARFGFRFVDLERGVEDAAFYRGPLDEVRSAVFLAPRGLARLGSTNDTRGWYVDYGEALRRSNVPADAVPQWIPNGRDVAFTTIGDPGFPATVEAMAFDGVKVAFFNI